MELHVYDFDGTLFRSPSPPGDWSDKGAWWSNSISLSDPCVPEKPGGSWWNAPVVSAARQSISNQDVLAILCTGRSSQSFARFRVPELLHQRGLTFDKVYLNPSGDTATFKKATILKLLGRYPDITTVHIYEDRLHHLAEFCQLVERRGLVCVPHPIKGQDTVCDAASSGNHSIAGVQVQAGCPLKENTMSNDGTNMKRLAELRDQRNKAASGPGTWNRTLEEAQTAFMLKVGMNAKELLKSEGLTDVYVNGRGLSAIVTGTREGEPLVVKFSWQGPLTIMAESSLGSKKRKGSETVLSMDAGNVAAEFIYAHLKGVLP